MKYSKKIKQLLSLLSKSGFKIDILDYSGKFFDEPPIFIYFGKKTVKTESRFFWNYDYIFGGSSFFSREEALLKCCMEVVERLSHHTIRKREIKIFEKKPPLFENNFNLGYYGKIKPGTIHAWVKGIDLTNNKVCLIPAQLIYPYFKTSDFGEKRIMPKVQGINGTAAGLSMDFVLLKSIYEIVERDAYNTLFLTRSLPKKINLDVIRDKKIETLIELFKNYSLSSYVFEITNDLQIPVFMTVLVDLTGVGPVVNLGFRAGFESKKTLLGSLEDAFFSRILNRNIKILQPDSKILKTISRLKIGSKTKVGSYYLRYGTLKSIQYLLSKIDKIHEKKSLPTKSLGLKLNLRQELKYVVGLLKSNGYTIYYKEITLPKLIKAGFCAYKVVVPGLQPPLRHQSSDLIFQSRLKKVKIYHQNKIYWTDRREKLGGV